MENRTIVGKFIKNSWTNMNIRCGKYRHLSTRKKCHTYDNIIIECTRDEFKEWCWNQQSLIENLDRPSIDRKNKNKNYTLENMQIIELKENIRKEKLTFTKTHGICFRCKLQKPIHEFTTDRRRINNKTNICKICDYERKKVK